MSEVSEVEADEETGTEGEDQTEDDQTDQDGGSEEEDASESDSGEVEVFITGEDSGSQPSMSAEQVSSIVSRRVNKANAKYVVRDDEANQLQLENDALKEQNALYKAMSVKQQQAAEASDAPKRPIAAEYLQGEDDAKFLAAEESYNRAVYRQIAQDEIRESSVQNVEQSKAANQSLVDEQENKRKSYAHYEKTAKLKVPDYDAMEDAAVASLGRNAVNQIINMADSPESSARVVYFLGKNPSEARHFANLIETDSRLAFKHLGKLEETVKTRPKASSKRAPDPDDERTGGSASGKNNKQRGPEGVTYS